MLAVLFQKIKLLMYTQLNFLVRMLGTCICLAKFIHVKQAYAFLEVENSFFCVVITLIDIQVAFRTVTTLCNVFCLRSGEQPFHQSIDLVLVLSDCYLCRPSPHAFPLLKKDRPITDIQFCRHEHVMNVPNDSEYRTQLP